MPCATQRSKATLVPMKSSLRPLLLTGIAWSAIGCGGGTGGTTGSGGAVPSTGASTSASASASSTGASTGHAVSTSGTTTARASTSGSTTATSTSTSTSTTSASATTGASTGTTGSTGDSGSTTGAAIITPPYQPFDGGPHTEPVPPLEDAGCIIGRPFPDGMGNCLQCRGDQDCANPLVCDVTGGGNCVACDQAHMLCPAGTLCDPTQDLCVLDCRKDAGACIDPSSPQSGGYCEYDSGICQLDACLSSRDCPRSNPFCVYSAGFGGPPTGSCSPCDQDAGSAPLFGCPPGEICNSGFGSNTCAFDCRSDAGACHPGICDFDGGFTCLPGACATSADCANSPTPVCDTQGGQCVQCTNSLLCEALGEGTPVCSGGTCTAACDDGGGGALSCGHEVCLYVGANGVLDGGQTASALTCVCGSDADCQGQSMAPTCVAGTDAGLDPDAGLYGSCGCTAGSCGAGSVCENRFDVLALVTPSPAFGVNLCISNCSSGTPDCAKDASGNTTCNPATGYCVGCLDNVGCNVDAGTPGCILVPADAGLFPQTGGGFCGCNSSAECDDGLTCQSPGAPFSSCVAACIYSSGGYDSCLAGSAGFSPASLCNTETGLCQECFSNRDCTGEYTTVGSMNVLQPFCSDAGSCYSCQSTADCPPATPRCVPTSDGFTTANQCVPSCTVDGGECATAANTPFCNALGGYCVQCQTATDCAASTGGSCVNGFCAF